MSSPVSEFLGVVMVAVIVLYGGHLVLNEDSGLEASVFIAYIAVFSQMMRPAKALTNSFSNIHSGIAAGERVLSLIDEEPGIRDQPGAVALDGLRDSIRLENVWFRSEEHTTELQYLM